MTGTVYERGWSLHLQDGTHQDEKDQQPFQMDRHSQLDNLSDNPVKADPKYQRRNGHQVNLKEYQDKLHKYKFHRDQLDQLRLNQDQWHKFKFHQDYLDKLKLINGMDMDNNLQGGRGLLLMWD